MGGSHTVAHMKSTLYRSTWLIGLAGLTLGLAGICHAQNPVIDWDNIAVNTALAANPSLAPASNTAGGTGIYLAYVHLAMYNAVNAIDGHFESYGPGLSAPAGASVDAAAIAAACRTLAYYFPD